MTYKRKSNIIFKDINGIVHILDPKTATVRTLNGTASFLWNELRKPRSVTQLAASLCASYRVDTRKAIKDVGEFVRKYARLGFLISCP